MKRTIEHFLEDIAEHSKMAQDFVKEVSFEEFTSDKMRFMATTRALEIIGEALNHIPAEVQKKYPEISWRQIIGFRNLVAHVYFGLNDNIIYNAAKNNTKILLPQIEKILQDYREGVI